MSNSVRHRERRMLRAKQKATEGQRGRRSVWDMRVPINHERGTNFMSRINAFLFKRHLFRRGKDEKAKATLG